MRSSGFLPSTLVGVLRATDSCVRCKGLTWAA